MNQTGIFRALAGAFVGSAALVALLVASPAQGASVTINDGGACATWNWDNTTRTLSCGGSTPPPPPPAGAPTGCTPSISTNPATLTSAGGSANPSVAGCTVTSGTITYAWYKNGSTNYSSALPSWSDPLPPNTSTSTPSTSSYQVNVCNFTACTGLLPTSPLTVTVPVASAGGGGGGGGGGAGAVSCTGFSQTVFYNWDWAGATVSNLDTVFMANNVGGLGIGTNGILVVAFTPSGPADVNNFAQIDAIGYPSPNQTNMMTASISTQPCDLSGAPPGTSIPSYAPTLTYGIGTVTGTNFWDRQLPGAALTPGVRYYINVAGRNGAAQTCVPGAFGTCELRLALRKPSGH